VVVVVAAVLCLCQHLLTFQCLDTAGWLQRGHPTCNTRNSAITDKPRDTFTGQSRSPNMVPFHMIGMVFYECPIVTLSVFEIFDFKNALTLKTGLRVREGYSPFDREPMTLILMFYSNYGSVSCRF